jgi:cytidylate kinase
MVVVAGRSNVGKSSFINFILKRKNIARTSCTPGRTRLLNFFEVDEKLILVDVPGYGYAEAPMAEVRRWIERVAEFIRECDKISIVVQLLDIRREPSDDDRWFAGLVRESGKTLLPVVTKADKAPKSKREKRAREIAASIGYGGRIILTSSKDGEGSEEVWKAIFDNLRRGEEGWTGKRVTVVTIDGPSGAGKSTVAKLVAGKLGFNYLDTGAMYRAIGWKADRDGVSFEDEEALAKLCAETTLEFRREGGAAKIYLDGEDLSEKIREHRVSSLASRVSAVRTVREAMSTFQRTIGLSAPTVAEGRDMGTVVFPDAFLKIYLTASPERRARRRVLELHERGQEAVYENILADIKERDKNDSTRAHSPLKPADDAVLIDSGELSAEEVAREIERLALKSMTRQAV